MLPLQVRSWGGGVAFCIQQHQCVSKVSNSLLQRNKCQRTTLPRKEDFLVFEEHGSVILADL